MLDSDTSTMSPDTTVIFGPPGTGKTTELLRIVESLIQSGTRPDQICYVGFTRRSANEARDRAMLQHNLTRDQLPWFRTLHSLAFGMLFLGKNDVMGIRDYISLAQQMGMSITIGGYNHEDGTFAGLTRGDKLFFMEAMARTQGVELKTYWESHPNEDVYWYELLQLRQALTRYKANTGKRDFTDVIEGYVNGNLPIPTCTVLIVDEAQDLSNLQWRMVEKLSDGIGTTYVAGDDDQAIFRWAGADVDRIISLAGRRRILGHSYRVPAEIQQLAGNIAARIKTRVDKQWTPRGAIGTLDYAPSIEGIDMSQGSWLLLARNTYLLEQFTQHCLSEGLIFEAHGESPISGASFSAITSWERLREGRFIRAVDARVVYDHMSTKIGVKYGFKGKLDDVPDNVALNLEKLRELHGLMRQAHEPWDVALDKIIDQEREYFLAALRRGEKLGDRPRIRISTIHGAKGAEADNVLLCTDMAERSYREMESCPDDEHRVWYVGVTRARERLVILTPQTNRFYAI